MTTLLTKLITKLTPPGGRGEGGTRGDQLLDSSRGEVSRLIYMGRPYFIHEATKFWYHPIIHRLNWLVLVINGLIATAIIPQIYERFITASLGFLFFGFGLLAIAMIGTNKPKRKTEISHTQETKNEEDLWSQVESDPKIQSAVKKYALSMMAQK